MAATLHSPHPESLNRRRSVRQKAHAPAYATFPSFPKQQMLELYEVLDISERGVALQCSSILDMDRPLQICLDLAEGGAAIVTAAKVIWSNSSGKAGLEFSDLKDTDRKSLQRWLFLNAMAGAANATSSRNSTLRPSHTDILNAISAIQREVESLGTDLDAALALVAGRSMTLLQASAAAIALEEAESGMTCRASVGASAPPLGSKLQIGSGFSGDCVRAGRSRRCDDSETDQRVDPETCRALDIRSMIASPIRSGEKVIGLIELFSGEPNGFAEKDESILEKFAEIVSAAVARLEPSNFRPSLAAVPGFSPPGSVLFASSDESRENAQDAKGSASDAREFGGIHFPRSHLYLLILAAATVALALGYILAPWIQERFHDHAGNQRSTVLAASRPPASTRQSVASPTPETANFEQLQRLAEDGNAAAENALGLLYAQGDHTHSVKQNESEAANWFAKAAEHGSVIAQYKLGLLYWGGNGVPKDVNKAYFWAVLARAGGQEGSRDLAKVLANGMTRAQAAAIEREAEIWYEQHHSQVKPAAGH